MISDLLKTFLGPVNENDAFDWSKFSAENEDDIEYLKKESKKIQLRNAQALLEKIKGKDRRDFGKKGEENAEGNNGDIPIEDEDGQVATISLLDPDQLQDREGNVWSGVILHEDMVQKTMPGNRVLSHRALVMIGNFRGAGGFGKGKGQTPEDALNAAFRAALRNVIHIDMYDNFGLAHDVHGKHNSCHAYITATSRDRILVGSAYAEEVLNRFGIGSASCKLVGRRDPYAMVNAIFNALSQHENIDEFLRIVERDS